MDEDYEEYYGVDYGESAGDEAADERDEAKEEENIEIEEAEKFEEGPVKSSRPDISRRPKVLTRYQYSKILMLRGEEIEAGKPPYIVIKKSEKLKPIDVAIKEVKLKKLPYVVRIKYPDGSVEYHYLKDMIIPRDLR